MSYLYFFNGKTPILSLVKTNATRYEYIDSPELELGPSRCKQVYLRTRATKAPELTCLAPQACSNRQSTFSCDKCDRRNVYTDLFDIVDCYCRSMMCFEREILPYYYIIITLYKARLLLMELFR